MGKSAVYPLVRPALKPLLDRGDAAISAAMRDDTRIFAAGSEIMSTDEGHEFVYRVRSGWAARARTLDDGRRHLIAIFLPEDLVGVKTMFLERQPDSVICLSDVVVEQLHHEAAWHLLVSDGSVAARWAFQLAEDERRLHNWSIGLSSSDAAERLAFLLVELFGRLRRLGFVREKDDSFSIPMTQKDIGDRLGLTVVHVNRVLRRFRENGLATVASRRVTIHDLAKLVDLAYPLFDAFQRASPEYGAAPAA